MLLFQLIFLLDGGSTYAVTKTSTSFRARHDEGDTSTDLIYLIRK
jgi:hypothetical protein